jgi:hypothetical protein
MNTNLGMSSPMYEVLICICFFISIDMRMEGWKEVSRTMAEWKTGRDCTIRTYLAYKKKRSTYCSFRNAKTFEVMDNAREILARFLTMSATRHRCPYGKSFYIISMISIYDLYSGKEILSLK